MLGRFWVAFNVRRVSGFLLINERTTNLEPQAGGEWSGWDPGVAYDATSG